MRSLRFVAGIAVLSLTAALPAQAVSTITRTRVSSSSIAFTTAPPESTLAGKFFTVAGTISPARSRMTIIQEKIGGKWLNMGRVQASSNGSFSRTVRLTKAGLHNLRAYSPANSQFGAATSEVIEVSTLAKFWLKDTNSSARFNGVTYAHSYSWSLYNIGASSTDWDLQRKCTLLSLTVGIADDARSGSAGRFEIYVDDALEFSKTVAFGESQEATIDLTGGLRLRVDVIKTSSTGTGMVIGDPQITCMPLA